jgi:prepilin-type N-terminal cleavage/methylation domain-containing protein
MIKKEYGVTLIELITAIVLMGLLITGFYALDTYARIHLLSSDRRAQLQNELSIVMEDMSKNIVRATGDNTNPVATHAIQSIANGFRVNIDGTTIDYTLSGNKIEKDGVNLNTREVILNNPPAEVGFTYQPLDNGTGIRIVLTGRYDLNQARSVSNPQLEMETRVYSRCASRN